MIKRISFPTNHNETSKCAKSLKFAMSLGKKDLLEKIKQEEDLVQLLQEHGPLKTKTIEDLRLTLMTVAVYHHLNM